MSYKGRDLDLRTPHAPGVSEDAAGQAGWSLPMPGRDGPIPVDQTVLACCNAAYDAALFHGARDVRVEHLLYALTRVDAARDILEQHGVRTQQLRRDAASAIVDEVPATGSKTPRSSTEYENVLRRAAGRAGQDSVPASVHDVMRAVLSYGRELPATALFLRSANDAQQLERWAAEQSARLPAYAAAALQPAMAQELIGRLESVETAMRTLATEVAADRRAMLDLMGEIQHELRAARQDGIAAQPAIVLDKIEDVGRSVSGLSERFEAIRTFAPGDGANALSGRLTALESKLSQQPSAIADAVAFMLTERHGDGSLHLSADEDAPRHGALERLGELESMMRAQTERLEDAGKVHERDLNEIFEALVKLGTNQQTLANNLEAWRLDSSGDVSIVSNRLENMERSLQDALTPPTVRIIEERTRFTPQELENSTGFKRWLYGTGRVLPSSWREDMSALRESMRSQRRIEKTRGAAD
ncbi:MAG TPA: Clp protease N-terminal domain-containing protein [Hyphomicrobiaceae bacterium]|nr:Clp protease N-terminal domain-containing protein [Hyphomicrobiaceae bacterium]